MMLSNLLKKALNRIPVNYIVMFLQKTNNLVNVYAGIGGRIFSGSEILNASTPLISNPNG
jgi:hypothetical protein